MKILLRSTSMFGLLLSLICCRQEHLALYDQPASGSSIYFQDMMNNALDAYSGGPLRQNYVSFGYLALDITDTILSIPVGVSGAPLAADREYRVVVDTGTTMKKGTHFEFLTEKFVLGAGKLKDTVRVKLHRTADLKDTTLTLSLLLQANDHFNTNLSRKLTYDGRDTLNMLRYTIKTDDITGLPFIWQGAYKTIVEAYLGKFSRNKLLLLISVMDIDIKLITVPPVPPARFNYDYALIWGNYMVYWLGMEKQAGRIYYDENGAEITMGPSAR